MHAFYVWHLLTFQCTVMIRCYMPVYVHICRLHLVGLLCMAWSLYLPHCFFLHMPVSICKRWNEDRKSNQCSRYLRAYRFPFHFPHSGKTKKDSTWVNEQTAEVSDIKLVTFAHYNRFQLSLEHVCSVCAGTVCVKTAGGIAGVSAGSYLCVTEWGTMWRIDAKPIATLQV